MILNIPIDDEDIHLLTDDNHGVGLSEDSAHEIIVWAAINNKMSGQRWYAIKQHYDKATKTRVVDIRVRKPMQHLYLRSDNPPIINKILAGQKAQG